MFAVKPWAITHRVMVHTTTCPSIEQDASRELTLLAQLRKGALERYFKTAESEFRFWATNAGLLDIYYSALEDWEARRAERLSSVNCLESR